MIARRAEVTRPALRPLLVDATALLADLATRPRQIVIIIHSFCGCRPFTGCPDQPWSGGPSNYRITSSICNSSKRSGRVAGYRAVRSW
jgi:hypothetical protein